MSKIVFFVSLLFFVSSVLSQEIKNAAYAKTLKTLLSHTVPEISVAKASQTSNTIFIDARELNEYNVSHIQSAYWGGYDNFDIKRLNGIPKNQKIIVYCSVGYRSEKIAEKLIAAGYTKTWNLYGGIFEWKNQGHPVYDNNGKETEKIHAYDSEWAVWLTSGEKVFN